MYSTSAHRIFQQGNMLSNITPIFAAVAHLSLVGVLFLAASSFGDDTPPGTRMTIDKDGKLRLAPELRPLKLAPNPNAASLPSVAIAPDCGANSLYVLLKLLGVRPSWDQIRASVPITGPGASMLDLKETAA